MKKSVLLSLLVSMSVFAAHPENIRIVPFVKNQVILINASTFTVTEIQFNDHERILSIQNGDIAAWTVDVGKTLPNRLFIKPTVPGSNTNMTVITDQHTYYFHLMSNVKKQASLYALKFHYPQSTMKIDKLNDPHLPAAYHWNYSFHGSTSIMPLHIFDDGRFTYFQLRPGQATPAIFAVDNKKGKESVVNFRKEGNYLVVHQLAPQFTLRSGKNHVASIFNNRLIKAYR